MNETQEYLEIMSGRKRLELEYKTGDIVSGYTAEGLHARIIESLHCGQYIDGWGFLVDREFEDGDIYRMKRHFYEWKEMDEIQKKLEAEELKKALEEKARLISGVEWKWEKKLQLYGGFSYKHWIRVEEEEFIFEEKIISGLGRVIVADYEVSKDCIGEALPELVDDRWYWTYISTGKETKLPMEEKEEKAYKIILKYGQLIEQHKG